MNSISYFHNSDNTGNEKTVAEKMGYTDLNMGNLAM